MIDALPTLSELSPERRALLAMLMESDPQPPGIRARAPGDRPHVSFAQERMWLAERLAKGIVSGVGTMRLTIRGRLNASALERAFNEIVHRHAVLRSAFRESAEGLEPYLIEKPCDLAWRPEFVSPEELGAQLEQTARQPFDLSQAPLFRASLWKLGEEHHELLFSVHHSIFDGWSGGIFARELSELYQAFSDDRPPRLAPLPIQYADYAAWQRTQTDLSQWGPSLEYWKQQLGGQLPALDLPADRPAPAQRTFSGDVYSFDLPAALVQRLNKLSREEGATPFMTLLAGFKTLLHRLTGEEDLVVGSPVANRNRAELEGLIGCFMQPVALRTRIAGTRTFRETLAAVRRVCLDAYAHQDVPFELVVRAIHPQWDGKHLPLFQVLFNVQSSAQLEFCLDDLEISTRLENRSSALDLSMNLWVDRSRIHGVVEYSTELFDRETIVWLLDGYQRWLEAIVERPETPLVDLKPTPRRQPAAAPVAAPKIPAGLSPERQALLAVLLADQSEPVSSPAPASIPRLPRDNRPLPASFGQERIWLSDQLRPDEALFNQAQAWRVTGPLNVAAFERAFAEIVRRHEVLRTSFQVIDGQPRQLVVDDFELCMPSVDLSSVNAEDQARQVQLLADEQCRQPFDVAHPPLFRITLVRCAEEAHILLMAVHHLVGDGWSMRVFRRELGLLYEAFSRREPSPLPSMTVQYADYAAWQRNYCRDALLDGQLTYWTTQLAGELPVLDLPADRPRPAGVARRRKARVSFEFSASLRELIERLGRQEGTTLFMTMLAGFQTLLHRYTGHPDLVIDSPIAGRNRAELEGMIGFFVNSLALRSDLSGRPSFRELLARTRRMCLGAYSNQDLPFDQVVAQVQRSRRGQPLTTASFMLHEALTEQMDLADGTTIQPLEAQLSDEFDLTLVLWRGTENLCGELQYDRDQFEESTIRRMTGHFVQLLESAVSNPDARVADLEIMSAQEQRRLAAWNETACPHELLCVQQLFEEQTRAAPRAVAVVTPAGNGRSALQLTYEELNQRANQLAHLLKSRGIGPESRVGLCFDRSPEMIVAVLGVLKAGGAYVPLDAARSQQRLEFMLLDAAVSLLISQGPPDVALPGGVAHLDMNGIGEELAGQSREDPPQVATPENLAYIMYTSGSTGRPKGALVAHRNLVHAYRGWEAAYRLRADTTCHLQMASFSFDVFAGDLARALCSGARLVLCPRDTLLDPARLYELMRTEQVDCAEFVPAVLRTLLGHLRQTGESLDFMRLVLVGSDVWHKGEYEQARRRCGPHTRLINSYGVAEATIDSSYFESDEPLAGEGQVPIGRPFANTQLHVLDCNLQPLPIGVAGELYLGGTGVSRNYLNRPELTAERFVPDPFSRVPGARLYRTGDRARYLADGNLEFLGRADYQIKIRGFRIEPGEVESVLGKHSAVRQAVVVAWQGEERDKQLVAYVVPKHCEAAMAGEPQTRLVTELREHVGRCLPDYMVPACFVVISELPLSKNGKVDRRLLPPPQEASQAQRSFAPPESQVQRQVAAVWSELLQRERIGLEDNFFDLGGHSLLLFQLQSKLREAFGKELPLIELFRLPTVQAQADWFAAGQQQTSPALEQARQRIERQKQSLAKKQQLARPRRIPR